MFLSIKSKNLLAASVWFSGFLLPSLSVNADPYIGIHIGQAESALPTDDPDDNPLSFEVNAGFALSENFSIEASYLDLGSTDSRNREWSMDGFTGSVLAQVPMAETASAFVRAGFYGWDVSVARKLSNGEIASDEFEISDGIDFYYGAGIKFGVADGFSAVVEYRGFTFSDIDEDASNLSLGVQYTFY